MDGGSCQASFDLEGPSAPAEGADPAAFEAAQVLNPKRAFKAKCDYKVGRISSASSTPSLPPVLHPLAQPRSARFSRWLFACFVFHLALVLLRS